MVIHGGGGLWLGWFAVGKVHRGGGSRWWCFVVVVPSHGVVVAIWGLSVARKKRKEERQPQQRHDATDGGARGGHQRWREGASLTHAVVVVVEQLTTTNARSSGAGRANLQRREALGVVAVVRTRWRWSGQQRRGVLGFFAKRRRREGFCEKWVFAEGVFFKRDI